MPDWYNQFGQMVQPWKDGLQLKVSKLLRHSHNWKEWKWHQLEIVPKNLWSLLFVCTFPFTAQLDTCLSGHGEVFGKITPILVQRWFVAFFAAMICRRFFGACLSLINSLGFRLIKSLVLPTVFQCQRSSTQRLDTDIKTPWEWG